MCGTAISRRFNVRMKELQAKLPKCNKDVPGNCTRKKKMTVAQKRENFARPAECADVKRRHGQLAPTDAYTVIPLLE